MFTKNSGLVKLWMRNIKSGNFIREQVPNLANLRDVVFAVLDAEEEVK